MITPLKVVGNKFVDQAGNTIRLLGTNNIGTHFACLTDQTPVDPVFGGVPFSLATLKIMHDVWGMNCVRVSINASCWLDCCVSHVTGGSPYQNAIISYIQNINAAGMYAIINLITTPSGAGEMADSTATTFWQSAGTVFMNYPLVLFEAYNEPYNITWATWKAGGNNGGSLSYNAVGMQSLINTIRANGNTQIILLDGIAFATDFTGFIANIPTDSLNQIGASWHRYTNWPNTDATNLGGFFDMMKSIAASYPTTLTEFGGSNSATLAFNHLYYLQLLNYCDYFGIGYLNWAWAAGPGIAILSDYTLFIPSAYGTAYHWHLNNQSAGGVPRNSNNTRGVVIPTSTY